MGNGFSNSGQVGGHPGIGGHQTDCCEPVVDPVSLVAVIGFMLFYDSC